MSIRLLLLLAACDGSPPAPELATCPACVCEPAACPAPSRDFCNDVNMLEYQEGVAHGKYFHLDAIVMHDCFDFAGEGAGWEGRYRQCIAGFHDWKDNFPGQSERW